MMALHMLRPHDQDWFRGVYDETYRPLLAYARRRVDPATADEVVADTFLIAWRRRSEVPDGSERVWLFGVARNMIRNALRAGRRRQAAHDRLRSATATEPTGSLEVSPEPVDERAALLRAALDRLAASDRELLMLVAWEELSHAETATVLGISANAVAIRVHRARKKLAARLAETTTDGTELKELPRTEQALDTDPHSYGPDQRRRAQ